MREAKGLKTNRPCPGKGHPRIVIILGRRMAWCKDVLFLAFRRGTPCALPFSLYLFASGLQPSTSNGLRGEPLSCDD